MGHDVYYIEDTGQWPYNPVEGHGLRFLIMQTFSTISILIMPTSTGKEHDFLLDALGGSHFDAKSDRLPFLAAINHGAANEHTGNLLRISQEFKVQKSFYGITIQNKKSTHWIH
jgi:hypothetical protein